MNKKIAVITPQNKNDYLTDTVLDGLISLKSKNEELEFFVPEEYPSDINTATFALKRADFVDFAQTSDLIFFMWGKNNTDYELADKIDRFDRTIFIDGSEVGRDRRFDAQIQQKILAGTYGENGEIDQAMLDKCKLYFRREKPYINGILPLPYGIESKYNKYYSKETKKDIDFFCVFGQEEFPLMRKFAKEILVDFCKKNGFTCFVEKVEEDIFYQMLARSKVGISIGGGGYDTARFWEILANNCLLLTEKRDIYEPDSGRLNYKRIWEFSNLFDLEYQLQKISEFLKKEYNQEDLVGEYEKIMVEHSTESRVLEIIKAAEKMNI